MIFGFRIADKRAGGITAKVGGAVRASTAALRRGEPLVQRGQLTPAGQAFQARLRALRRGR